MVPFAPATGRSRPDALRTQPRPHGQPYLALDAIQNPLIDAYLGGAARRHSARILASRTAFIADSRVRPAGRRPGLRQQAAAHRAAGMTLVTLSPIIYCNWMPTSVMSNTQASLAGQRAGPRHRYFVRYTPLSPRTVTRCVPLS